MKILRLVKKDGNLLLVMMMKSLSLDITVYFFVIIKYGQSKQLPKE